MSDGTETIRAVDVDPKLGVKVEHGVPPGANVSCECTCTSKTFIDIYENRVHPRSAIMSGNLKVHGFAFRELGRFGASFDTRTEKWNEYYAHLRELERVEKAQAEAHAAAAKAAQSQQPLQQQAAGTNLNSNSTAATKPTAQLTPAGPRTKSYTFLLSQSTTTAQASEQVAANALSSAANSAQANNGIKGVARLARDHFFNWLFRGTMAAAHHEQRLIARVSQLANVARSHIRANGPALQSLAAAVGTALFLEMNPISTQHTPSVPSKAHSSAHMSPSLRPEAVSFSPTTHPQHGAHAIPTPWQLSSPSPSQESFGAIVEGLPAGLREEILAATPKRPTTRETKPGILGWLEAKKNHIMEMATQQRADVLAKSFPQRMAFYLTHPPSDTFDEDHAPTSILRPPYAQLLPQMAATVPVLPGLRQPLAGDLAHHDAKVDAVLSEAVRARGRGTPHRLRMSLQSHGDETVASRTTTHSPSTVGLTETRVFPSLQQPSQSADKFLTILGEAGGF